MFRFSFAAVFALVSLVLSASATPVYDVTELGEEIINLDERDLVSQNQLKNLTLAVAFVGDLTIGERRYGESFYSKGLTLRNPTDKLATLSFYISVQNEFIHFVSILNGPGSYAAVCDRSPSLGTSKSYFNARVVPNSIAQFKVYIGAH